MISPWLHRQDFTQFSVHGYYKKHQQSLRIVENYPDFGVVLIKNVFCLNINLRFSRAHYHNKMKAGVANCHRFSSTLVFLWFSTMSSKRNIGMFSLWEVVARCSCSSISLKSMGFLHWCQIPVIWVMLDLEDDFCPLAWLHLGWRAHHLLKGWTETVANTLLTGLLLLFPHFLLFSLEHPLKPVCMLESWSPSETPCQQPNELALIFATSKCKEHTIVCL